jgi:hypothetical protein
MGQGEKIEQDQGKAEAAQGLMTLNPRVTSQDFFKVYISFLM